MIEVAASGKYESKSLGVIILDAVRETINEVYTDGIPVTFSFLLVDGFIEIKIAYLQDKAPPRKEMH